MKSKKDRYTIATCIGGFGEKKSNGGTQYYQQDRVYMGDIALAHLANLPGGSYMYIIEVQNESKNNRSDGYERSNMTGFNSDNGVLEQMKIKQNDLVTEKVGNIYESGGQAGNVYNSENVAPCVPGFGAGGGGKEMKVLIKQATKQGYIECKIGGVADLSYPDSKTRRGRVQDCGNTSPTLTAGESDICKIESPYRIRKLTPLECWRLMGFTDDEFGAAESVNSNTQLYKQAGNSIVVDVLASLFNNIFEALEEEEMKKVEEIKTGKF